MPVILLNTLHLYHLSFVQTYEADSIILFYRQRNQNLRKSCKEQIVSGFKTRLYDTWLWVINFSTKTPLSILEHMRPNTLVGQISIFRNILKHNKMTWFKYILPKYEFLKRVELATWKTHLFIASGLKILIHTENLIEHKNHLEHLL